MRRSEMVNFIEQFLERRKLDYLIIERVMDAVTAIVEPP